ncbi:hypothetical protein [Nitrospirillum pindoramense]|uniref:UrcA family protein n=1 Tax=Nitrospirillum amazonense TaxID=28077 RepID=A0A560HCV2_9PROT|nr:hypothetical protein [Nitrospirillum amazonense]TWB44206.1 hypothetical protein FBZ90_103112 [Nitrospirillum amazonense]
MIARNPSLMSKVAAALVVGTLSLAPSAFAAPPAVTVSVVANAVRHACQQTLGLTVNDTDYAACITTLTQAATNAQIHDPSPMPDSRACAEVGTAPGSADFARCVANLDGALDQARLAPN